MEHASPALTMHSMCMTVCNADCLGNRYLLVVLLRSVHLQRLRATGHAHRPHLGLSKQTHPSPPRGRGLASSELQFGLDSWGSAPYAQIRLQVHCESTMLMRDLEYGSSIERRAVSSRLAELHPVSSPFYIECALKPLKGASAPRASW